MVLLILDSSSVFSGSFGLADLAYWPSRTQAWFSVGPVGPIMITLILYNNLIIKIVPFI